jgi:hypothetical protein
VFLNVAFTLTKVDIGTALWVASRMPVLVVGVAWICRFEGELDGLHCHQKV